jgi:hypothetical protein
VGKLKLEPQKFCEAFYDWAKACQTELPTDDANTKIWRQEFRSHWQFVEIAIQKSCLLYRLIYAGESLRAKMCRVHRGKMERLCTGEIALRLSIRIKRHRVATRKRHEKSENETRL